MVVRRLAQFRGAMRGTLPTVLLAFAWPVCAQSISGTVVDAHSDSPLDGATVVLVGTLYATAADSAGTFTLGPLPVGSYDMEVWRHGYLPSRQRVTLTPDRDLVTSIRLSREYRETPLPAFSGARMAATRCAPSFARSDTGCSGGADCSKEYSRLRSRDKRHACRAGGCECGRYAQHARAVRTGRLFRR